MKFSKKSQENARSSSPSAGDPDDFVLVPSQVLNKNIAFPSHLSPSLLLHKDVYLSVWQVEFFCLVGLGVSEVHGLVDLVECTGPGSDWTGLDSGASTPTITQLFIC